uniref:Elongin-A n=2 Tax=Oryza TaxID=4527 RepID=A0A0E0QEV1_ORYRU
MEYGRRKPISLLELCIRTTMDNLRYVDNVDGVEMDLLQRILPHCKMEDLTRIENNTEMDLTPVTDKLWKLFYTRQFGEENANQVVKRMSMSGARYKWKDLFDAKTKKQKEYEEKMGQRLAKKYEAAKAGKKHFLAGCLQISGKNESCYSKEYYSKDISAHKDELKSCTANEDNDYS